VIGGLAWEADDGGLDRATTGLLTSAAGFELLVDSARDDRASQDHYVRVCGKGRYLLLRGGRQSTLRANGTAEMSAVIIAEHAMVAGMYTMELIVPHSTSRDGVVKPHVPRLSIELVVINWMWLSSSRGQSWSYFERKRPASASAGGTSGLSSGPSRRGLVWRGERGNECGI